jgi:hypothetical protein
MNDIYTHGGSEFITYVPSEVQNIGGRCENKIDINHIVHILLNTNFKKTHSDESYNKMSHFIEENYSWNRVSHYLFDYFNFILKNNRN